VVFFKKHKSFQHETVFVIFIFGGTKFALYFHGVKRVLLSF